MIAFETHTAKLGNLRRRAGRAGATNIKTVDLDGLQEYSGRADCVFIDAPCSGWGCSGGTLMRNGGLLLRIFQSLQQSKKRLSGNTADL